MFEAPSALSSRISSELLSVPSESPLIGPVDAHVHLFPEFSDFAQRRTVSFLNAVSESDWEAVCRAVLCPERNAEAQGRNFEQNAELRSGDFKPNAEPQVVPFLGIHPWAVLSAEAGWEERLEALLRRMPIAGVGEIGLDAWKPELQSDAAVCRQKTFFQRQLALAVELDRPVSIHCVRAWDHLWELARPILAGKQIPLLFHAFSGSPQIVSQILQKEKWNAFFSIASFRFHPDRPKSRELLHAIPRERLLLETDAESAEDALSLETLCRNAAECLRIPESELSDRILKNVRLFFGR